MLLPLLFAITFLSPQSGAQAVGVLPVEVTTTLGMPDFSISVAGRAAAGAQFPQAPLPEITASHPFSCASAAI